jgi:DNA invertase Pin-like site-specific DNA recombinase
MLRRSFDPRKPHRYARYGRMSSDQQNPRSPEQQFDTVDQTLRRLGHSWVHVGDYRDDGVSGRYLAKRTGFQQLLRDIRTGTVQVDAILVDTFERFGRAEEMAALRQELEHRHGVLVLTADTQFADPTTVAGKALALVESIRSTEDGRIKAHNVLRGKRDAARLKHWPGGPPPFGFRLESVLAERHGRQEVDHCVLVPDPETAWIIRTLFQVALERGWGCTRLARMLNEDPSIPGQFKPFYDQTVNYWLKQEIYYGELVWEEHATGVVDDRRVIEKNPAGEVLRVPDFCEPLVPREVWEAVQQMRQQRSARAKQARQARKTASGKQIAAVTPGLALNYLLSGLVRCGDCNRAMTVSSSPAYTTRAGETKRYASYVCPGYVARVCPNGTRVPEGWLREVVVGLIFRRLFQGETATVATPVIDGVLVIEPFTLEALQGTEWFGPLVQQVQEELDRLAGSREHYLPTLERELQNLQDQVRGWSQSLAKSDLAPAVRSVIETDCNAGLQRQRELERQLVEAKALRQRTRAVVEPGRVVARLNGLAKVLAQNNPTRGNLELSMHIDQIRCHQDGRVIVRTCKLGALAGSVDLLADMPTRGAEPSARPDLGSGVKPRRRARLRIESDEEDLERLRETAVMAADVHRFGGLGPEWFSEDVFQIPRKQYWSDTHAVEVAAKQQETGCSLVKLAAHFRKSVPTVRLALKKAKSLGQPEDGGSPSPEG